VVGVFSLKFRPLPGQVLSSKHLRSGIGPSGRSKTLVKTKWPTSRRDRLTGTWNPLFEMDPVVKPRDDGCPGCPGCRGAGCRGCRVSGVRCQVSGVGCRVSGVGCRVSGVGCRVSGVGCRVSGVRCQVSGDNIRVSRESNSA